MSWTAPMTAVANDIFTASQFNTNVRDNLLETAPAKATTAGSIFVSTGANAIAERIASTASVATSQTTTSTTYADLATVGPAVTVNTGTSAFVGIRGEFGRSDATASNVAQVRMAYAVSGATTIAATDVLGLSATGLWWDTGTAKRVATGGVFLQTGLTPGSNTFTAKYRVSVGTGTYVDRLLWVLPL